MPPIDPVRPSSAADRSSMSPTFDAEDNVNLSLVEEGMDMAEDERRDAVADAYESLAKYSDDPKEALADIDYNLGERDDRGQEMAAIHAEDSGLSMEEEKEVELFSDDERTPDEYEEEDEEE